MSEETILTRRVMLAFAVLACIFLSMACASANENVTCGDDNVTECAVLASADNGSGSFEELSGLIGTSNIQISETLAIREAISFFVLNGHHVDLGKFGIFGIRSKQKAVTDAEQVDASLVKHLTVGFKPSTDIKEAIATLRFEVEV